MSRRTIKRRLLLCALPISVLKRTAGPCQSSHQVQRQKHRHSFRCPTSAEILNRRAPSRLFALKELAVAGAAAATPAAAAALQVGSFDAAAAGVAAAATGAATATLEKSSESLRK